MAKLINNKRLISAIDFRLHQMGLSKHGFAYALRHLGLSYTSFLNLRNNKKQNISLTVLYSFCHILKLNPTSFICNNDIFLPDTDLKENENYNLKSIKLSNFFKSLLNIFKKLKSKNKDLNIILSFINFNYAIFSINIPCNINTPCLHIHMKNKNKKIYSAIDQNKFDINNIKEINFPNFTHLDNSLIDSYLNIINIFKLKYKSF